tara:strand:- start:2274 stop:3935 length:1662 start_codon:yes stop_codon:yes gene_type:complete
MLLIHVDYINAQPNYFEISKGLEIFNGIFKEINMYYVDETKPGELMDAAIESMLKTLDPYTTFIPESDIEDFRFQTTGEYGGIGSLITKHNDNIYIAEPYKNFPADNAGLKIGDKIITIGETAVKGKSVEDVSNLLKGEPGTEVKLTINRIKYNANDEIEEVTIPININREKITISSVPYYGIIDLNHFLEDSISKQKFSCAYVKLNRFTRGCTEEVRQALLDLESKEEFDKIILDLRGNPGGLLNESVGLCNLFIPQNEPVVSTKGRNSDWNKIYKTKKKPYDIEKPLIILVDQNSASASEIVAGTIQDLDRGVIIGFKTFGKGLVQQTRKLDYNSQLKVTVAKYYTPSGRCIQKINYANKNNEIVPDSLKTEFKTKNGRSVFDGGGIEPDIKIQEDSIPAILYDIVKKRIVFDFGNHYYPRMESIHNTFTFNISDEVYTEFVSFLEKKEFEFETESEKQLAILEDVVKYENYNNTLNEQFVVFQKILNETKKEDVFNFKKEISLLILDDLITREHYNKGRVESMLKFDRAIIEALKLFANNSKYNALLYPY